MPRPTLLRRAAQSLTKSSSACSTWRSSSRANLPVTCARLAPAFSTYGVAACARARSRRGPFSVPQRRAPGSGRFQGIARGLRSPRGRRRGEGPVGWGRRGRGLLRLGRRNTLTPSSRTGVALVASSLPTLTACKATFCEAVSAAGGWGERCEGARCGAMAEGLAKEWPPPNHGAPPAQVSRLGRRTASMLSFCGSDAVLAAAASRLPGSECAWARVGPPRGTIAASPPAVRVAL